MQVTLKFVSAEDGLAWYNFYKETCTQDDDIYEDTEAMPSTPDEMSGDGDAAKCRSIVSDEGQSLSQSTEEMGGTDRGADKVSDSSASESRHFSDSPQPSSDEITRHTTDSAPKLITEDIKVGGIYVYILISSKFNLMNTQQTAVLSQSRLLDTCNNRLKICRILFL